MVGSMKTMKQVLALVLAVVFVAVCVPVCMADERGTYDEGYDQGYQVGYDDGYLYDWMVNYEEQEDDDFGAGYEAGYGAGFDEGYALWESEQGEESEDPDFSEPEEPEEPAEPDEPEEDISDTPAEPEPKNDYFSEEAKAAAYELLNNEGTGYFYYYRDKVDGKTDAVVKDAPIELKAADGVYTAPEAAVEVGEFDGKDAACMKEIGTTAQFTFNVETEGLYAVNVQYQSITASGKDIDWYVKLDGEVPYDELDPTALPLVWKDSLPEDGNFRKDEDGNELRPTQLEVNVWTDAWLQDTTGQYNEPYLLYLTAGEHVLTFTVDEQPLYLAGITLGYPEAPASYEDYKAAYEGKTDNAESFQLELEKSLVKSSSMLYPIYDRATPATTPNVAGKTVLNTIGGANWGNRGSYITWEVEVPADGWYNLAIRERQNINEGLTSYRSLAIDGVVPYAEADAVPFKYNLNWQVITMGGGDKPVYLTKGSHTVTMTVGTGEVAPILRDLNQVVLDLNTLYRKIIMITSVTPDIYQDYNLPTNIPGILVALNDCADRLTEMSDSMKELTGSSGSKAYLFDEMAVMLREFVKTPFSIADRLSNFKSELESLGSLLMTLGNMPVEMDKVYFVPVDEEIPNGKCSFWESFTFNFEAFISSFSSDYRETAAKDEDGNTTIQVWVSTGRDQAQIIRRLIDDDFTLNTGIKVKLSITDTGTTLIQATLAGKGPHCALCIAKDTPVNLAMRGGLVNLLDYGVDKLVNDRSQYYASAWQPYWYNNGKCDGVYAIPETQTFNMMFYRTDIFEELGLDVPQTWDEFYRCIEVIQGSNLTVGMLETNSTLMGASTAIDWFNTFLFQNGGTYFNDDMSATRFHEEVALDSFTDVVNLYKEYGLDRDFNFFNRFRSGELPLAITSYTQYNMMSYAAPEVNGLWAFAPVPGTPKEDGSINRAESSAGTACIMLNKSVTDGIDEDVYKFLTWWTSADVQATYGVELEATMGPAMRYSPANLRAFEKIPWSSTERKLIADQWQWIYDIREIPGNYYISRSLTSALRLSIDNAVSARRELLLYNEEINTEITRKRKEFGLE